MIPKIVEFKSEQDLEIGENQQTEAGKYFELTNNGKIYVYKLKDGTYKLRFDNLGKEVLQKYPWGLKKPKIAKTQEAT